MRLIEKGLLQYKEKPRKRNTKDPGAAIQSRREEKGLPRMMPKRIHQIRARQQAWRAASPGWSRREASGSHLFKKMKLIECPSDQIY